ncbi:uncharacterized protein FMAN_07637 [Fusarium mangiferae]|uniref:Uncharacterized protein n=1 Tax=Fusarium mangiferae TaxID=192010 RepID=A0A1L7TB30_FUSMA|nr:uncharacterized protein FMAN_07637 [Fusarium mangiferae]CVK92795.1 uncharacterized protein FMAN_07637 [Fusarium mangiferae]
MAKTSAVAQQVLDLFQHVHGNKGFGVPGINDPVNEPTVVPITKYNNPAPNGYQKAPKLQSKGAIAAWNEMRKDPDAFAVNCVKHKAVPRQDPSDMNPIYFPAEPRSPAIIRIGALAGVWQEDLDLDKRKTSSKPPTRPGNKGQRRASEWHGELLKQDEARKKGQPAYYTVTINKAFSLQFSWKDAKGKIAEFEAKFRHDLYWGNAMKSSNRDLTIATGRSMLRKFAAAKAKGSAFRLGGVHLLRGLMAKLLIRDVDDATIAKIEAYGAMCAQRMAAP